MNDTFIQSLVAAIGPEHADTTCDPPILTPPDIDRAAEVVARCDEARRGIRIVGGGTSPVTGDGSLVRLSMRALDRVTDISREDYLIVAEAGAVADDVVARAAAERMYLPLTLPDGDRATIGGAFMSGAFAACTAADGSLKKSVIGLRAISARGEVVTFGGRTVKNVTGFEVTRLLAGSRGVFAIAAELIIKALPMPERQAALTVTAEPGRAGGFVAALDGSLHGAERAAFLAPEGLGGTVTAGFGFAGFGQVIDRMIEALAARFTDTDGITTRTDDGASFRRMCRALGRTLAAPGMVMVTVPPAAGPAFLEGVLRIAPASPLAGHPGYGRYTILGLDDGERARIGEHARTLGGSDPLPWDLAATSGFASVLGDTERSLARALKRELDPHGILNPHLGFA